MRKRPFDLSRVPDDAESTGRSGRRSSAVDGIGTVTVAMFITVKFGENESLLCNPSCAVINLLNSIRRRAGYANTNVCLDLSDETGKRSGLDITSAGHVRTVMPTTSVSKPAAVVGSWNEVYTPLIVEQPGRCVVSTLSVE